MLILLHLLSGFVASFQAEADKVKTSLYHSIYNGRVLHWVMQVHVGLVGRRREMKQAEVSITLARPPGASTAPLPPKRAHGPHAEAHALSHTHVRAPLPLCLQLCGCRSVSQHEGQTRAWWDQSSSRTHWQCKPLIKSVVRGETPVKDLLKA